MQDASDNADGSRSAESRFDRPGAGGLFVNTLDDEAANEKRPFTWPSVRPSGTGCKK